MINKLKCTFKEELRGIIGKSHNRTLQINRETTAKCIKILIRPFHKCTAKYRMTFQGLKNLASDVSMLDSVLTRINEVLDEVP